MRPYVDVTSRVDDPFLRHALALAERGRGATAPNPMVGCVVVSGDRIVGEGFHPRAGEPHAEVFALRDAGEAARGSHVYVTLEPCSHHGRTPPCTDALIAAGVARVTVGMADPSATAGGGAALLRASGIEVDFAADPVPFAELNRGWLKRSVTGMPWITAKVGLSLDARISLAPGTRASMTGPSGASVTRMLRTRADAVVVGCSTVIADDPALTVRDDSGTPSGRQPLRVVLLGEQGPPADACVFTDGLARTLALAAQDGEGGRPNGVPDGVEVAYYDGAEGLAGALRALGTLGINEVLVEPGRRLLTSLWGEGLIDELVTVTAGGMAGPAGPSLYDGEADSDAAGPSSLQRLFKPVEAGIVGDVSVTVWRPDAGPDER